jgi:hypothetical protein
MITKLLRSTQCGRKKLRLSFLILLAGICSNTAVFADGETPAFTGTGTGADAANAYVITSAAQLDEVRNFLDAYFKLSDDITLTSLTAEVGWEPIGTEANKFTGHFDGNGKKITGLWINRSSTDGVGLFGYTDGGSITNLTVETTEAGVTGKDNVGVLVGSNKSNITNCSVSGKVTGKVSTGGLVGEGSFSDVWTGYINSSHADVEVLGTEYVGGLVGSNNVTIDNICSATGKVTGNIYVGGLAGFSYGNIFRSYATGEVESTLADPDDYSGSGGYAGGLVGVNRATIYLCFATGNVTGDSNRIGGLVGQSESGLDAWEYDWVTAIVENSYATGEVAGVSQVGGLVGWTNGNIVNSYATGAVPKASVETGISSTSGLVGVVYNDGAHTPVITSSYFDKETSGIDDGFVSYDKSTAQMKNKNTFTGWDFAAASNKWLIREGADGKSYPYLYYQSAPAVIIDAVETGVKINLAAVPTNVDYYLADVFQNTAEVSVAGDKTYEGTFTVGAKVTFITKEEDKAPSYPANGIINRPEITDITPHGAVATARLGDDLVLTFNRPVTGVANKLITITEEDETIYGYAIVAGDNSVAVEEEDITYNRVSIPFTSFVEYAYVDAEEEGEPTLEPVDEGAALAIATGNTYKLFVQTAAFTSSSAFGEITTEETVWDEENNTPEKNALLAFNTIKADPELGDLEVNVTSTGVEVTFKDDAEGGEDDVNFGAITVKYTSTAEGGETPEGFPTEAGEYALSVSITEGLDFEAATNLSLNRIVTVKEVTFNVVDEEDGTTEIGGATVAFNGVTNAAGNYAFTYIASSTATNPEAEPVPTEVDYDYTVTLAGYLEATGEVEDYDAAPIVKLLSETKPPRITGINYDGEVTKVSIGTDLIITFNRTVEAVATKKVFISDGDDTYTYTIVVPTDIISGEGSSCQATIPFEAFTGIISEASIAFTTGKTYKVGVTEGAFKSAEGEGEGVIAAITASASPFTFTTVKADITVEDLEVEVTPAGVTVEGPAGLGAITVKYDGEEDFPTEPGEHALSVSIADSPNYTAAELSLGSITVEKVTFTVTYEDTGDAVTDATVTFIDDDKDVAPYEYTYISTYTEEGEEEATPIVTDYAYIVAPSDDDEDYIEVTGTVTFEEGSYEATVPVVLLSTETPPVITEITPTGNVAKVEIGTELVITFNREVTVAAGKTITITSSNGAEEDPETVEYTYTTSELELSKTVSIPFADFEDDGIVITTGLTYTLTVAEGAFVSESTISSAEVTAADGYIFTAIKATPDVEFPVIEGEFEYESNKLLSTVNPTGSASVVGTFDWVNPATVITPGTKEYAAIFTPSNTDDYNEVNGTITLKMAAAPVPPVTPPTEEPEEEPEAPAVVPAEVSLNLTILTLEAGKTQQLVAIVRPLNADNKNVTWTSSDAKVATVANGVVTAVAPGTATITVTTVVGGYTATCAVTVTESTTGIAKASEGVAIRSEAGKLYVDSPAAETVYVYSLNGKLLYTATKASGLVTFDAPSEKLLIVRGTSGWAKKVSK